MASMGYCRFENTFKDLQDCLEYMDDKLSESEEKYKNKIINLAHEIDVDFGNPDSED